MTLDTESGALKRLLDVVAEALEIDLPDRSANFLDLGGDSLSAIVVVETMEEEGRMLDVEALFSTLSLGQVAALLEGPPE
jgi:acyl carrier protein